MRTGPGPWRGAGGADSECASLPRRPAPKVRGGRTARERRAPRRHERIILNVPPSIQRIFPVKKDESGPMRK